MNNNNFNNQNMDINMNMNGQNFNNLNQYGQYNQQPKKHTWIIVLILCVVIGMMCCCGGIFGFFLVLSESDDSTVTVPDLPLNYSYNEYATNDMTGHTMYSIDSDTQKVEAESYWKFINNTECILHNGDNFEYTVDYIYKVDYDAIDYLTEELADYGITYSEAINMLTVANENKEAYLAEDCRLVCINFIKDGKNIPYFGYIYAFENGEVLYDIAGMNSCNYYNFILDNSEADLSTLVK